MSINYPAYLHPYKGWNQLLNAIIYNESCASPLFFDLNWLKIIWKLSLFDVLEWLSGSIYLLFF